MEDRYRTESMLAGFAHSWLGAPMTARPHEIPREQRDQPFAGRGIVVGYRISKRLRGVWFKLDNGRCTYRTKEWLTQQLEQMLR